jgi:hypothetical protein
MSKTTRNDSVIQLAFSEASLTEPSAVAPDPKSNFNNRRSLMPKIITRVDSNIRRYRARFCKHKGEAK